MKTLLAAAIILTTTSAAYAHDSCDVILTGGVRINPTSIEFLNKDQLLYKITANGDLEVDGDVIALSSSQQSLVNDYATRIRAVVPEVRSIAIEGIDLAVEGVNLAFGELLGANSNVAYDITDELTKVRTDIDARFSAEQSYYFDEEGMIGENFFGEEFEKRIEATVENAVKNSMGSLLVAVGQQMLFSGGDMDAFETRMENFGQQIEQEMEAKGEKLEQRGEALCMSIVEIDTIEEQLKHNIDALAAFNVLTIEASHRKDI